MECRGCNAEGAGAEPPAVMPPKNLPPAASSHHPPKKNQAIKNNLGGNEISIIDCKAVYPTHLKCRRRWRRPESPHVGWGCMHARLERRRREKKKKGWGRSREERRNKQTVERKKKTQKRPIRKRSLRERHCYRLAHTLLLLLLLLFFAAPAKVSRVGSNGKGKRWSEPISHIRGGLFAPSLSCA